MKASTGRCRRGRMVVEGLQTNFADPTPIPSMAAGVAYSCAFFSAKHLGTGQYYLMTIKDKEGQPFDGGRTYRLNVPANAPVKQYWSATVYDRETHALIRDVTFVEPIIAHAGASKERRRLGRYLLRT